MGFENDSTKAVKAWPGAMTGDWHTYAQAAELLGISPNAVRHRAQRGRWQRTLGNDKRIRICFPDGWEDTLRIPSRRLVRRIKALETETDGWENTLRISGNWGTPEADRIPAKQLIEALEAHIETLKAHLTAAEARTEKLAADFAERDAKHAAELAIERTLVDHMSARVDQLTAELAAERAMAERGLAAELARAWWKPLLRRS